MKKYKILILLLVLLITVGCNKKENDNTNQHINKNTTNTITTHEQNNEQGTINCTREASSSNDITASFSYQITYKGDYIMILHSVEKVTSNNPNSLDQYEKAYQNIQKNYEGLKYYDNKITRDSSSVTNDTTINYEKIDTDKLLEIEGSEDNVIKDGKVKVSTWMDFAKKLGVTCDN